LWKREGFRVPRKTRKRRGLGVSANGIVRRKAAHRNDVWCWDFIHCRDEQGRILKWLMIEDEYTREALVIQVGRSLKAKDVLAALATAMNTHGVPGHIRSDNGPEFIAQAIRQYLAARSVGTLYIEPGAPWENGYAESLGSRFRDEFLNTESFRDLREATVLSAWWHQQYNHERPHSGIGYRVPAEYAAEQMKQGGCRVAVAGSQVGTPVGASPLPAFPPAKEEEAETLITAGT
jgi:transposase InsO family protein